MTHIGVGVTRKAGEPGLHRVEAFRDGHKPARGDDALGIDEGLSPPIKRDDGSWLVDGMKWLPELDSNQRPSD